MLYRVDFKPLYRWIVTGLLPEGKASASGWAAERTRTHERVELSETKEQEQIQRKVNAHFYNSS